MQMKKLYATAILSAFILSSAGAMAAQTNVQTYEQKRLQQRQEMLKKQDEFFKKQDQKSAELNKKLTAPQQKYEAEKKQREAEQKARQEALAKQKQQRKDSADAIKKDVKNLKDSFKY